MIGLSNLQKGMKIWSIHLFQDERKFNNTVIEEFEVLDFPILMGSGLDNFINLKSGDEIIYADFDTNEWYRSPIYGAGRVVQQSMQDMGIIPNTYNNHKTFSSLTAAQEYACNVYNIPFVDPQDTTQQSYNQAMQVLDL